MAESLILKQQADIAAAPFFPNFDLPEIDKTRPKFHCTGERLFRDRPDIYRAVVQLLAEPGVSIRTICRDCHVSDHTVRSVADRERIPIATQKKQVLSNITHGLRLASERVIELMPEASARDALIGVGILGEKMQLLGGDATARIDLKPIRNPAAEVEQMYRDAEKCYEEYKASVANGEDSVGATLRLRVKFTKAVMDRGNNAEQTGVGGENLEQKALRHGEGNTSHLQSGNGAGEAV